MYMFGSYEAPFSPRPGANWTDADAVKTACNEHFREARHYMTRASQSVGKASEFFEIEAEWHKRRARQLYDLLDDDGKTTVAFDRFIRERTHDGEIVPLQTDGDGNYHAEYARELVESAIENENGELERA